MIPVQAHMAAKVCSRLWEEFDELYEELGDWGDDEYAARDALDELKERLLKTLPYGPREE